MIHLTNRKLFKGLECSAEDVPPVVPFSSTTGAFRELPVQHYHKAQLSTFQRFLGPTLHQSQSNLGCKSSYIVFLLLEVLFRVQHMKK